MLTLPIHADVRAEWRRGAVVAGALLIQLVIGAIQAWSIFQKPLGDAYGWTISETTVVFTINYLAYGFSALLGGLLIARFGPRRVAILAGVLYGGGIGLASLAAHQLWILYLTAGLLSGIGRGIGYVVPVAVLVAWFPERRGTMTGLSAAAFGGSALLAAPLGAWLIITLGVLPTFALLGSLSLVLVVGAASVLSLPAPAGLTASAVRAQRDDFALREALRTWQWYGLWLLLFVTGTVGLGLVSQMAPMVQEVAGIDPLAAAGLISIVAAGNIVGRFFCGSLSDVVGCRAVFFAIIVVQAVLVYALAFSQELWMFALCVTVVVLGHGGSLGTMPAFIADYYGPRHVGEILGLMLTASGFASLLGPLVLAVLREQTGSYSAALALLAGLTALGAVTPLLLRPPSTRAVPLGAGLVAVSSHR